MSLRAEAHRSVSAEGTAFGAVSVLSALPAGVGCAIAIDAPARATWQWMPEGLSAATPGADDRLVRAVHSLVAAPPLLPGAKVATHAAFPPARGLKTSSSVAGALVAAAFRSAGREPGWQEVARLACDVSLRAGVSLTGAFDDQVATVRGGAHLTDNAQRRILRSFSLPRWHVAVWVPEAEVAKRRVAGIDHSAAAEASRGIADALIRCDDPGAALPEAMTSNGSLLHRLYAAHGLPVDDRPTRAALAAGALGAGLSGTGPAVAALFDRAVPLEPVAGGTWRWHRAVPEAA